MKKWVGGLAFTFAVSAGLLTGPVHADERPIRIIVGYGAGGATDLLARFVATHLGSELNRTVLVENRPGGNALIANRSLAKATPDGTTYLLAPHSSTIFREIMYDAKERGYSMITDYVPVATLTSYPLGLAASPHIDVDSVQDLVDWVKANPKEASFGSAAMGSHTHLVGSTFSDTLDIGMQVIPFASNGASVTALIGNHIPAAVISAVEIASHGDKVKILGVFTEERSPLLPDVKTMIEQGVNVAGGNAWMALWAPAATPKEEIESFSAAIEKVLSKEEVVETLRRNFAMSPMYKNPEEMEKYQAGEIEYWREVIEKSGFSPQS